MNIVERGKEMSGASLNTVAFYMGSRYVFGVVCRGFVCREKGVGHCLLFTSREHPPDKLTSG